MSVGLLDSRQASAALSLRAARPAPWLPPVVAALVALVGLVNVGVALSAHLPARLQSVLDLKALDLVPVAHTIAMTAGASLLALAFYLRRRRRGAWALTILILLAAVVIDLVKGLDIGEGLVGLALAAALATQRKAFFVRHDRVALRSAMWRVPLAVAASVGIATLAVWAGSRALSPHIGTHAAWHEARHLLTLKSSEFQFHRAFSWVPFGVHLLALATVLAAFYFILRPLSGPRELPGTRARALARDLVETHGADTLSYFKLRQDKHYLFSSDERAFVGYQVEGRMLLISADPVGPDDALPELFRQIFAWAEVRGLKVGVINAGERTRELTEAAGLRSFYFGDEALLDLDAFSLAGRPIRKVRQSVTRLTKAGYTSELVSVGDLPPETKLELEGVSQRWMGKDHERGFSMAMDSVCGQHHPDTQVVIARDEHSAVRGFLHLVPAYGRPAMSLSAMRREHDTPNGLTEFLVVRAVELLREQGVRELSLNFAAFGRWMHDPRNRREQLLGRACKPLNPYFQIESLYKFNAKFFPRWEPRYLIYEGRLGLLPTSVAALIVEGQLPRPRLPFRNARRAEATSDPSVQAEPAGSAA